MSKGFKFIKNKQEEVTSKPQPSTDLFPTIDDNPPKKGFGFIKKSPKENNINQQSIIHQEQKEESLKPSLDSLFANDTLFNFTNEKKEENNLPESNLLSQSTIEHVSNFNNDSMNNFAAIPKEYSNSNFSPKVSTSSLPGKKGFAFIKKNKEEADTRSNLLGGLDINTTPMSSHIDISKITQAQFNINNQFMDDYESQLFKNDQSENCSVSSKKNYSETKQNMINSPKVSSTKSIPINDTVQDDSISKKQLLTNYQIPSQKVSVFDSYQLPQNNPSSTPKLTDESVKLNFEKQKKNNISSYLEYILSIHRLKLQLKAKKEELNTFKCQQAKLISDEQLAIEENDFEKADHIETIIKGLIERISKINQEIIVNTQELMSLREKELNLLRIYKKETEEIGNDFVKLKQSTEDCIESFNNKELSKHHSENIRLKKMKEKLQFLKGNLDIEKNYIDEEEDKILIVIKSQSSGIFDELDDLNKSKDQLNHQIEELKRQLEAKENELYLLNDQIESKENEIETIKSNFNHDFSKIDIKKKNYSENLQDYQEQENNFNKKHNDYEILDKEYNDKMSQMKNKLCVYDQEIEFIQKEKEKKSEQLAIKESLLQKENSVQMKMTKIESQIESSQEIMKKHNDDIQKLNINNKQLESEISQIEIRLPVLEEEKNNAIKAKNFKEAGRVSNIFKTSLEQKNTNLSKILENKRIINDFTNNVNNLTNKIDSLASEKKEEEVELKKIQYKYMNDHLESLLSYSNQGINNTILTQEIIRIQEELSIMEQLEYIQPIRIAKINEQSSYIEDSNEDNEKYSKEKASDQIHDTKIIEENSSSQMSKDEVQLKIEELNKNLQEVINNEDYEAADTIQTEIDKMTEMLNNQ